MSTIKFEQAVFLSENKSEIEEVKTAFREIACKVMSNTLVQITNFELIERVIEAENMADFIRNVNANLIAKKFENILKI